jgi:hypothetical protein
LGGVTPTHLKLSLIDWLLYLQQIALFDQKKRIYSENKLVFAPWYFLLPAIAFFLVYVIIPIFQSVWISFYEWDGLGEAQWVGLAQFYDRDAIPEMAAAGMEGFQEFMMKPDRLDKILKRLDKIQSKVYK